MPAFTSIKAKAIGIAVDQGVNMLYDDFDGNLPKVESLINKFAGSGDSINDAQLRLFNMDMGYMKDPTNNWRRLVDNIINNVDKDVVKTFVHNFFVNSVTIGGARQREVNDTEGCNCPWAILMDPTTRCNLHCNGCWAANYTNANHKDLTFEELDSIITQGKDLGTYIYLFTGGEPMVRKDDIIRLCETHPDCMFLAFTNGTLIDGKFAEEMLRVKNFVPAISVEGFEEATDSRRGAGTYQAVMGAMQVLKEHKLPFGISCCYTSQNLDSISSEAFIDDMVARGAKFAWYFHYMPVGMGASTDLLLTPEQRTYMKNRVREIRGVTGGKELYCIDFQNDGEFAGGCVAGGRIYCHINAAGDVEPCVFIHYSGANIREKSFLECLQQPLFLEYRKGQPFNGNHLRPCPMLENPDLLPEMVKRSGARSTDLEAPESAEHLCEKCKAYAACWQPTAEQLWDEEHRQ